MYVCIYIYIYIYSAYIGSQDLYRERAGRREVHPRRERHGLDTLQRGVQSEGGAVDGGSII